MYEYLNSNESIKPSYYKAEEAELVSNCFPHIEEGEEINRIARDTGTVFRSEGKYFLCDDPSKAHDQQSSLDSLWKLVG